jgi:hypothetical protein
MVYAALAPIYLWVRYQGYWMEQDTGVFVNAIGVTVRDGTLFPERFGYHNGFVFQVFGATLSGLTGLPVIELVTTVTPFLTLLAVVPAFALFRELLGEWRAAALATWFVFLQPEFLFTMLRGNHEKLTLPLAMLALYLLVRSFHFVNRLRTFATFVGAFYLIAFAIIATNTFFGSSFTFALALAFLAGSAVAGRVTVPGHAYGGRLLRRLTFTAAACLVLVVAFSTYLYPVAGNNLHLLRTLWDKLSVLFLGLEPAQSPYTYVTAGWVLPPWVYLAIMLFSWCVLALSGLEWLNLTWALVRGQRPQLQWGYLLTALFYTAFGLQFAVSIIIDFSGFLGANLQVRIFPWVMLFAIPLAVERLRQIAAWLREHPRWQRVARPGAGVLMVWFAIAALVKATNEPNLMNAWIFHTPAEADAMRWSEAHLRYREVWTGPTERLRMVHEANFALDSTFGNYFYEGRVTGEENYVLYSPVIKGHTIRSGRLLPDTDAMLQVYDNGAAVLYKWRPATPYQK